MSADPIPADLPAGQGGVQQAPVNAWIDIKDDFLDFLGLDASPSGKLNQDALFADIANRWKGLSDWGLGKRADLQAQGPNGAGDTAPWNLHYPGVIAMIARWNKFHDLWQTNRASMSDDDKITALYQAAADVTAAEWASRHVTMGEGYNTDRPWAPIVLPTIVEALGRDCTYDGTMHLNITPETEQTAATLRARWKDLLDWGVRTKLPQWKQHIDEYDLWNCKWNYNPDVVQLQNVAAGLDLVEADARELGYQAGLPVPPMVSTPGWGDGTRTAEAATAAENAAAAALKAAEAAASGAGASLLGAIPTWLKVVLGIGAVAGVAAAVKK